MVKENLKEQSPLFTIIKKVYEKVNFKLNIVDMGVKLETYAIEKKFFPRAQDEKTENTTNPTHNSESSIPLNDRFESQMNENLLKENFETPLFKN